MAGEWVLVSEASKLTGKSTATIRKHSESEVFSTRKSSDGLLEIDMNSVRAYYEKLARIRPSSARHCALEANERGNGNVYTDVPRSIPPASAPDGLREELSYWRDDAHVLRGERDALLRIVEDLRAQNAEMQANLISINERLFGLLSAKIHREAKPFQELNRDCHRSKTEETQRTVPHPADHKVTAVAPSLDGMVSLKEAAERANASAHSIKDWCQKGLLGEKSKDGRWYVKLEDVLAIMGKSTARIGRK